MKKRTKKETKALAKKLFLEQGSGKDATELAEKYGIHRTYVNVLIRRYKIGKFDKPECPTELNEILLIDQNGPAKQNDTVEIIVYQEEDISQNFKLEIEQPTNEDIDDYELEVQKRIMEKLRWMHAGKEFKIGEK